MEDVLGVELDPSDVPGAAGARLHTDPGTELGHPSKGHRPSGRCHLQVEGDWKVEEDDPGGGDPEIVHHHRPGDIDDLRARHLSPVVDHVEPEERGAEDVVAEEDELTGGRIDLRVGRHRRGESTVEVVDSGSIEPGGEGEGEPGLGQGQGDAGMANHMGVRRAVDGLRRPSGRRGAEFGGERPGAHPPVPVARGLAIGEADGMDHSVAAQPVVLGFVIGDGGGIGAVAHQAAAEVGRDHACRRERSVVAPLVQHGGEVAGGGTGSSSWAGRASSASERPW